MQTFTPSFSILRPNVLSFPALLDKLCRLYSVHFVCKTSIIEIAEASHAVRKVYTQTGVDFDVAVSKCVGGYVLGVLRRICRREEEFKKKRI